MARAIVDMRDTMQRITLKVTIKHEKETRFRLWLATKFIKLAALIMGCGIEFSSSGLNEEVKCPVCNGMPIQIDRFDHFKFHECTFCKGKGKVKIE